MTAVCRQKVVCIVFSDSELFECPREYFRCYLKLWRYRRDIFEVVMAEISADVVDQLLRKIVHQAGSICYSCKTIVFLMNESTV